MSSLAWPPVHSGIALFLDVDGTLMDLAPAPAEARLHADTVPLLERAFSALDGALALVSGRSIQQIDELVWPLRLPLAGVHGLERRSAQGQRWVHGSAHSLDPVRKSLQEFVDSVPGLLLEDKSLGIAIHYRRAPSAAESVLAAVNAALGRVGESASLQRGDMVVEIKAGPHNKASAVSDFMRERPFSGRTPVFIGDDATDEDALQWASVHGGFGIAVGDRVAGKFRLGGCREVATWLEHVIAATVAVE